MHPRNPYRVPPDFASLAQAYPPLQRFLLASHPSASTRSTIDFKDEQALRCLTQAIMLHDYGITLEIPKDRLCPPVPNRMNYVLWIQDVVNAIKTHQESRDPPVHGIDIGTGATAIYPLLACKSQETWRVVGTELDQRSYNFAVQNVQQNALNDRITIRKASKDGPILFPLEDNTIVYDFTMCNPPFYSSVQEIGDLSKGKNLPPRTVCTGSETEMVYHDNGEVGFVNRMVEESVRFQGRCRWYTSMLGRMSSVVKIVELLRGKSITNYAVTEFVQGQTRRWAIGWSFLDGRLPDSISRILLPPSHTLASVLPPRTTLRQPLPSARTPEEVLYALKDVLNAIEGLCVSTSQSSYSSSSWALRIEAADNTWSRSARRKKKQKLDEVTARAQHPQTFRRSLNLVCGVISGKGDDQNLCEINHDWMDVDDLGLGGKVDMQEEKRTVDQEVGYSLEFQWISGMDRSLFESFVGHVGRKIFEYLTKH